MAEKRPAPIVTNGLLKYDAVKIAFISGPRPYLRLEHMDGTYLGCVPDRKLEQLARWARKCAAPDKHKRKGSVV